MEKNNIDYIDREEFEKYKQEYANKIDNILVQISKPPFTANQLTGFLMALLGAMATIMIYVTTIKSDARNNTTRIDVLEEHYKEIDKKLDKIIEVQIIKRTEK